MKLSSILDKEGLSLAGMILIMSILALLVGVVLGNWLIRIVAGPSDTIGVVDREPSIQQEATQEHAVVPEPPRPPAEDIPREETGVFVVQVGAFNSRDNAQRLKGQLEEKGFTVWITDTQPYRVHLGAFDNRQEAEELRDDVERKGFEAFITH